MPAPNTIGGALMGYPTTVDIGPAANKTGLAQVSGGALQWGIPGSWFSGMNTYTLSVNQVVYCPVYLQYTHTLTAWELEVTAGPASNANIRVGIYQVDGTLQPLASTAPLYDSGSTAVASGFTGIKTATALSITLLPGMYVFCVNVDTAMTVRAFTSVSPFLLATLGASSLAKSFHATQTYGAFPTPGTAWTAFDSDATGVLNVVAWQWTE